MKSPVDPFLWANRVDAEKDNLDIDLFLFNKNNTVYSTNHNKEIKNKLKVLFVYGVVSDLQTGAATGMSVQNADQAVDNENTIFRIELDQVAPAQEVIEQIMYDEDRLEQFESESIDFRRIKGVVARITFNGNVSYIFKALMPSHILREAVSFGVNKSSIGNLSAEAGFKITPDSQVMIVDNDIFVFNQSKFIKLFNLDVWKRSIVSAQAELIQKTFNVKCPDDTDFIKICFSMSKASIKTLIDLNLANSSYDKVESCAEDFNLGLMFDEKNKGIIIMDSRDAELLVNILNDNYANSGLRNEPYLMKTKKKLDTEESQLGMGGI